MSRYISKPPDEATQKTFFLVYRQDERVWMFAPCDQVPVPIAEFTLDIVKKYASEFKAIADINEWQRQILFTHNKFLVVVV